MSVPMFKFPSVTNLYNSWWSVVCLLKRDKLKIINLHDKTEIYTSRFVYKHQDSYIYIKIRIYTVYIQKINVN